MKKLLQLALGIIAAIGGYLDIGDLVFTTGAGATYGYKLLWAVPVGVLGIAVYAEMCGRVAAVTKRPVMDIVRQRLGFGMGLATLCASQAVNLMTLAAEVGGLALVLQLLFDFSYTALVLAGILALIVIAWRLPFEGIERLFGYGGLLLVVYLVAAIDLHPDWGSVAGGFVPELPGSSLYMYFAVGLIAAAFMPYEVHFYSSGGVEEGWGPKDLNVNRMNAFVGFALGGLLALVVTAAQVYQPIGVRPEFIGTTALMAQVPLGEVGLLLALGGILFAVGGAAIDTCFSGAYNLAQFLGWEWGKYRRPAGAPRFTLTWLTMFGLAFVIIVTGVDPIQVTEYAVIFSAFALPLTFFPVLLVARDRAYMGEHANGRLADALGWLYLVVVGIVAVLAVPLIFATTAGGS